MLDLGLLKCLSGPLDPRMNYTLNVSNIDTYSDCGDDTKITVHIRCIEAGVRKFPNPGPPENLNFIMKVIKENNMFQYRKR